MVFNSSVFALFFLVAYSCFHLLGTSKARKLWIITICNLVFYASWGLKFVPLLLAMGTIDYYLAQAIARNMAAGEKRRCRALVALSLLSNLGLLIGFKYLDFFADSGCRLLTLMGWGVNAHPLSFAVPLGLSFYTFQSLSYILDVYRKQHNPKETLLEFLASLTFFPHLLAGPIVRSSFLVPQFTKIAEPSDKDRKYSAILIAGGLTKKALADVLAPIVETAFTTGHPGLIGSWAGVLGFAGQAYGDISGYTDMATGIAMLLGFRLPPNMNLPYLSTSPVDFWKRWHISISTWFRDYLYLPMAFGFLKRRPYLNLFLVMVAAGLWHGPGLNYVIFGAYHGLLLVLTQYLSRKVEAPKSRVFCIGVTFYLIIIGQAIFRAQTLSQFAGVFLGMHGFGPPVGVTSSTVAALLTSITVVVSCHFMDYLVLHGRRLLESPVVYWSATTAGFCLALIFGTRPSFIYFQF